MTATYNEIDEYAADWISNLITAGHVAPGRIDTRSITELTAEDVRHARQAHFFAGIAAWSAAARAAGWPDDAPLWTGSCPCQPFSQAGRGKGVKDERHLWPEWFRLIRECMPPVIVGEQVASPAGLGWLDAVFADLEGAGYACAAADLCAASVGAPHIRQRLYFVAVARGERLEGLRLRLLAGQSRRIAERGIALGGTLADASGDERGSRRGHSPLEGRAESRRTSEQPAGCGDVGELGNSGGARGWWHAGAVLGAQGEGPGEGGGARRLADVTVSAGTTRGFWSDADWILCSDGKARPVEPGTFPLAYGATARVGRLRAYGNAIVRPQAQAFLEVVIGMLTATTDPTPQLTKAVTL